MIIRAYGVAAYVSASSIRVATLVAIVLVGAVEDRNEVSTRALSCQGDRDKNSNEISGAYPILSGTTSSRPRLHGDPLAELEAWLQSGAVELAEE